MAYYTLVPYSVFKTDDNFKVCIACKYSGSDEQAYMDHGCPACICSDSRNEDDTEMEDY